jgi:predicted small lipoprotein YifL
MKKAFPSFFLAWIVLSSVFCGRKGSIYPPLVKNPKAVEVFQVFQRGDKIALNWNNPSAYTDGSPLEAISRVEIWLYVKTKDTAETPQTGEKKEEKGGGDASLTAEEFRKEADVLAEIPKENFAQYQITTKDATLPGNFLYFHPLSLEDLKDKTFTFALKTRDNRKKESDFSALLSVKPKALPSPPGNIKTTVMEDKISLEWSPPEKNIDGSIPADVKGYLVYRKSEEEGLRRLSENVVGVTQFDDKEFQFEVSYTYTIRSAASDSAPFLESSDSDAVIIVPKDTFPPPAPTGLVAISGAGFISLSWDSSRESDLSGYRVWRKKEKADKLLPITELIRDNVYNDTGVEKNERYDYAITALDKSGNESKKSKSIIIRSE